MPSLPASLFIPNKRSPRAAETVLPQQRTSMEDRKRAMVEDNPDGYQNESGFGPVNGIPIFKTWSSREECARDRMHAPLTAGIWGGKSGAYSVVVSGGYEDDKDEGETITYTGTGGFGEDNQYGGGNTSGRGAQKESQTFEHRDNQALWVSCNMNKPVRVIRGERLKSDWAPETGYRYDGIYKVEKAYMDKSKNSDLEICRFVLKRVGDQPAIPRRGY